jgi:osmotically-inducible protein OsmY
VGIVRRAIGLGLPTGRIAMAAWGWRHRHEVAGWAQWAARSAPRLAAGDTSDLLVEGRLKARLTANGRTRDVDGLRVEVQDGVARLWGTVPADVHDAAFEIASNTTGVKRVRDELVDAGRRRSRR